MKMKTPIYNDKGMLILKVEEPEDCVERKENPEIRD